MSQLHYINTANDLFDLLLQMGNPKFWARIVADDVFKEHGARAYEHEELVELVRQSARAIVNEAAKAAADAGKIDIGIDEDGDFAIM